MIVGRRQAILGTLAIGTGLASADANACSYISVPKPILFKTSAARNEIGSLVEFANRAHALGRDEIADWLDSRDIDLEGILDDHHYDDWWEKDGFQTTHGRQYGLLKHWRISSGVVDKIPIRITDFEIIKNHKNYGVVQFTLERSAYSPAYDGSQDSCVLSNPEGFFKSVKSYLGVVENNRLRSVKHFPEWLLGSTQ